MESLINIFSQHWDMILVFIVLILAGLSFIKEWMPPDMVAMFSLGAILLPGIFGLPILSTSDITGAFSNPAPLTIACMFVMSAGLERSGCIRSLGAGFKRLAGQTELRALVTIMIIGAVLSAFVNNTPVVVVFLPIVISLARSSELKSSRLLMPLSFACILGGTCTLTGSSTNLIIDGIAQEQNQAPFSMFELTKLGAIYAAVGFIYMLTIGKKLLPKHDSMSVDLSSSEERDFLTQVIVQERDRILISVHSDDFKELKETEGLRLTAYQNLKLETLERRPAILLEGIIGPQSTIIGRTLKELKFRQRFGVLILGVHRQSGEFRRNFEDVRIHSGDTLLIEGPPQAIARVKNEKDFVSLSETSEPTIRKGKALIAAAITFAFVIAASVSGQPIFVVALIASIAMLATRCIDPSDAYNLSLIHI